MNTNKIRVVAAIAVVLVWMGTVMLLTQREPVVSAQDGKIVADTIAPLLHYQGRLNNPTTGQPVADGSYTMVFRLYTAPSGGAALWTEARDVAARDGLFSTVLGDVTPLDQSVFNGQTLWLGVKVGTDEEARPRQQLLPVAYALGLVPGATIQGNSNSAAALNLSNTGGGEALHVDGPVVVDGDLTVNGDISSPSFPLMPLAFGYIGSDGEKISGSSNVSSEWHSGDGTYDITIAGHSYNDYEYVTVVTLMYDSCGNDSAHVAEFEGKLIVFFISLHPDGYFYRSSCYFQFITFKQ